MKTKSGEGNRPPTLNVKGKPEEAKTRQTQHLKEGGEEESPKNV